MLIMYYWHIVSPDMQQIYGKPSKEMGIKSVAPKYSS